LRYVYYISKDKIMNCKSIYSSYAFTNKLKEWFGGRVVW